MLKVLSLNYLRFSRKEINEPLANISINYLVEEVEV
jgi:hypothetical protein